MEGATGTTIGAVLEALSSVYEVLIGMFKNVIDTLTGNALLFTPILIALLGGVVFYAVKVIRKLGVRGVSSRR